MRWSIPMPPWLTVLAVMAAVAALVRPDREGFAWFLGLRRPPWLTFERWIPVIWLAIYACFYGAALLAWRSGGGWGAMAGLLVLLLLVQSYTWVICRTRRLASGTAVGFLGWVWGIAMAVILASRSRAAALLLVPYLLWSPVGTFVTWKMEALNRRRPGRGDQHS